MTEPTTTNIGLVIPSTGDLVGQWGPLALNPDFNAIDGLFGGVATIGLSNSNVTLTTSGATITPAAGPYQANNAILRFTGALTANIVVTLPLPGFNTIENLTTGNYVVQFIAPNNNGSYVVSTPQGSIVTIYNDGANTKFVSGIADTPGKMEFWAGVSSLPAWVTSCAPLPYLVCDGTVYNFSTYPYLGARLGGNFGGNGITTFGVPDLRGRVPLAYDGTGGRITAGISGISGTTLGSAGGDQSVGAHYHFVSLTTSGMSANDPHTHSYLQFSPGYGAAGGGSQAAGNNVGSTTGSTSIAHTHSVTGNTNYNTSYGAGANIPPAQVAGIWVIKAA